VIIFVSVWNPDYKTWGSEAASIRAYQAGSNLTRVFRSVIFRYVIIQFTYGKALHTSNSN